MTSPLTPHVPRDRRRCAPARRQGSASPCWWNWLEGCAAYRGVLAGGRESIVHHMVNNDILVDADARLALGARGERLYGARNFLELYVVFSTPRVLRVMHGQLDVGVVDASLLQDAVGYPRWFDLPVSLKRSLCQAMRRVLANKDTDLSWSKRAITQLKLQRESDAFIDDSPLPLEEDPDGHCRWWTFGGGAGNRVLAGLLELEFGERVSPGNTFITFSNGAAESAIAIRLAIDGLAARSLTWDAAARLVDLNQRSRVSRFRPCHPPNFEHGLIAREMMNIDDANAALTEWKRGAQQQEADA